MESESLIFTGLEIPRDYHPEKEEQHYEQRNLFEAGPMH